ncbi:hypothetical protein RA21_19505 [Leisingera sp. ANG-DT]|nr:hypothetical protein RA21_19505 [Leisingera sp. ANG-DT]
MLSWTGFDWGAAPLKWQVLDVVYLALDLAVAAGLLLQKVWGMVALIFAACSQILLYSLFRNWVLDVPPEFEVGPSEAAYLDGLLLFHTACLLAISIVALRSRMH